MNVVILNGNGHHYQDMLPVLHQVNVSLINDEKLDRRQKVKISLLFSFCTNDGPQAQRGGNEDVGGVKGGIESDAPLKYCHSYTKQPSTHPFISSHPGISFHPLTMHVVPSHLSP